MYQRTLSSNKLLNIYLIILCIGISFYPKFVLADIPQNTGQIEEIDPTLISEQFLEVKINNVTTKDVIVIITYKNKLFLPGEFLDKFKMNYTNWKYITYLDNNYFELPNITNINYQIDNRKSIININIPANLFTNQDLIKKNKKLNYHQPAPGLYLNYEALVSKYAENKSTNLNSFNELVWFGKKGIIYSSFTLNRLDNTNKLTRLETRYEKDTPNNNKTLIIGDTRTAPGIWGGPVLFGGIQYKNNFLLTPEFLPYPLPDIKGQAALPSVVDVFVNDNLTGRFDANMGPFSIFSIPTVTGSGTIKVIQQDVLGQKTIYEIPFYTSPILLKKGLKDYEINLGATRNDFYYKSNLYSRILLNGFYRKGITNNLTLETRGEALKRLQNIGLGSSFSAIKFGTITLAQVISNNNEKLASQKKSIGAETRLLYSNAHKYFNVNLNFEYFSESFASLGQYYDQLPPKVNAQAFLGVPLYFNNSIALNYIYKYNREPSLEKISRILTANYSHNLFNKFYINLSANYDINNKSKQFFMYFSGNHKDYNASYSNIYQKPNKPIHNVMLNKMSNKLYSLDYDLRYAKQTDNNNFTSEFFYKTHVGDYNLGLEKQGNDKNYRFQANGSILYLNKFYLSRRINDGFAIVDTDNVPNIDIYQNNHKVATTDKKGKALITNINSYSQNRITLNTESIPLNYSFNKNYDIIVPYKKTGNIIKFKFTKTVDGSLVLVDDTDNAIVDGASVFRKEDKSKFVVGYDGFVYLDNILPENTLEVSWTGKKTKLTQTCLAYFKFESKPNEIQPDLGSIKCFLINKFAKITSNEKIG